MEEIDIHKIYKRQKRDRDIFQELMPFKIKEILFIANYYDAYTIEQEGQFTDKIIGEYLQVNLYTAPRFTCVANKIEALEILKTRHIDLIIVMAGLDRKMPYEIGLYLKKRYPDITQLMLVNNNSELEYYHSIEQKLSEVFERIFVWNGSTKIFLAMAKYIEDKKNVDVDAKMGDIRVILLVENSVRYYSKYLPLLYTEVVTQTQKIIQSEPKNNDLSVVMKIRIRPKVILVSTYEEAVDFVHKYINNIIGVISDVRYNKNGKEHEKAGIELIKYVRRLAPKMPCLLQSRDAENSKDAESVKAFFLNKNSLSLSMDITGFIKRELGFGDFIFRNHKSEVIDKAVSIDEFKKKLLTVPEESLLFHSERNDFSTWLMARGEMDLAKTFRKYNANNFDNTDDIRSFIISTINENELKQMLGRIMLFNPNIVNSNRYICRIGSGSLGGKGRGMTFLCNFIENTNLKKLIPDIEIKIPKTTIIGVDEYDNFIENNNLGQIIYSDVSFDIIQQKFVNGNISDSLHKQLKAYAKVMTKPLAVRSSGLFEDSLNQPFAGVYSTYIIANNHRDLKVRVEELETAIKLVWASIFTESSKNYFNAIDCMIEEEKMAIILQEVVGSKHNGRFYPNISGVAQSFNFYPFSYIKPEDGFSVAAIGLGAYVVGGGRTCRFCPSYPKLKVDSLQDSMRDSQKDFLAIDMTDKTFDPIKLGEECCMKSYDIADAEDDGTLQPCATVYDYINDRLSYDFSIKGSRIVNFENILQYNSVSLAPTLDTLLKIFTGAMGSPVEIEYALNQEDGKWVFYLLQIKPLIKQDYLTSINEEAIDSSKLLLKANKGMGNGTQELTDIVYIKPSDFNRLDTEKIASDISKLNAIMKKEGRSYILIGPGRWGTRDKLTGIPVQWTDISEARVIVEIGLKDYPLDASLGSHFFHNVTSMNVGYFAIPNISDTNFVNFEKLAKYKPQKYSKYVSHIRSEKPFKVIMDGKKQISIILES